MYAVSSGTAVHTLGTVGEGDLYIRSVVFSPDSQLLATGAEDKSVRVWDIKQERVVHTLLGHEQEIYSLDWGNSTLVSGSGDKSVKVLFLFKKSGLGRYVGPVRRYSTK